MEHVEDLTPDQQLQALAVVSAAHKADQVKPVNESAELIIRGQRPGTFILDGEPIIAIAILDDREHTIEVVVAPDARRRGLGSQLVTRALGLRPGYTVWAFGTLPAARALADSVGLTATRELLQLARPLEHEIHVSQLASEYHITTYTPSQAAAVVSLNGIAFEHHPEQGKLTVEEFMTLTSQEWFDPSGLLLALTHSGELAGFHWTKRHSESEAEVYVLAVHPAHSGAGLGRTLLESGLAHLFRQGARRVHLYVEGSEGRVVRLYETAGFTRINTDTAYAQT